MTHLFAPPPNAIVDDNGRLLPEVLAARRRGIVFDVGNGVRDHIRWDTVEQIMRAGFWPDTISTDWNVMSRTTGVVDLPNCMSKLLGFGMSVSDVVAAATVNAARTFDVFRDRGTLNVGAPADVAVLELREGEFEFLDNYENTIKGRQRLFPSETVLARRARAARLTMARPRTKFRSLRVTAEFRAFVLDQLAAVPQLRPKAMFGGVGLYSAERFFGILAADELFFKVDDGNRAAYEAAGSEPFRPVADRPVSMSYFRVPLEVLEDPTELVEWARAAIRAANAPKPKRTLRRAAKSQPSRGRPKLGRN